METTKSPFPQEMGRTLEDSIRDLKETVKQHPTKISGLGKPPVQFGIIESLEITRGVSKTGIVFYTDGSARPNPGPGGWGFHGYLFSYETPTKGTGNSSVYLTNRGYIVKTDETTKELDGKTVDFEKCFSDCFVVKPLKYFDGAGSFNNIVTNNVGELAGLYNALQYVKNYIPATVLLKLDSQYVLNGFEVFLKKGWFTKNPSEIKNLKWWEDLWKLLTEIRENNPDIQIQTEWTKGHNGELGNEKADRLARIGTNISTRNGLTKESKSHVSIRDVEGYWSPKCDKHPLVCSRRLYFNSNYEYHQPGTYYMGSHGKDDEMVAKRLAGGEFVILRLKEPEPMLELLIKEQSNVVNNEDKICIGYIDNLMNRRIFEELTEFGVDAIQKIHRNGSIGTVDESPSPLSAVRDPALLGYRVFEMANNMTNILDLYDTNSNILVKKDITNLFFDTVEATKKKPESKLLKKEIGTGVVSMSVMADWHHNPEEEEKNESTVSLSYGIDLPTRNALKRIETMNPKITLITWADAPQMFRYATMVETDDASGLWVAWCSNIRLVS